MPTWASALPIQRVAVLAPVYLLSGVLLVLGVLPVLGVRGNTRRRAGVVALAAGTGALMGWLGVCVIVDLDDVFGAPADDVIRAGAVVGALGVAVGAVNLIGTHWWRKAVGAGLMLAAIVSAGLMINRDVSFYPTLGDVIGESPPQRFVAADRSAGVAMDLATWRGPRDMPAQGALDLADIPGTESHFHARQAWVYLPPAALVHDPPKLPVIVVLTGQPGEPSDVFQAGNLRPLLDSVAAQHHGVAPIVVAADQLGSPGVNPMCVDSPKLGDVATYITRDVRAWVLHHLPASGSRRDWSVMGFSQGATCAVQFGTGYPAIFGSFVAVAPELGPFDGDVAHSVREAFGGNETAWQAAQPIAIMRKHGRYLDTRAIYSVGAGDWRYRSAAPALSEESTRVGMDTDLTVLPGVAHDWNAGALGFQNGLDELLNWWDIADRG